MVNQSTADTDSLIDTPTNYEASSGNNGGNYCTWNPLNTERPSGAAGLSTLANGNLDNSGNNTDAVGTMGVSSGKWYFEVTRISGGSTDTNGVGFYLSGTSEEAMYRDGGLFQYNGSASSYGASWSTDGVVIGVALDLDNTSITFYKDGSSQGVAKSDLPAGTWIPLMLNRSTSTFAANFGQRPFAYTPPTGYLSLCTQNLPDPTIADGSTAMDVALWTGNGSTQSISGLSMSPDLVWIKNRGASFSHHLYDVVRGVSERLRSDRTNAADTAVPITSFDSAGFTLPTDITGAINQSSNTYVGWAWDGGTSTATNTDGSITANVRANQSTGFSIVSYTGTGSAETIGHGLNAAPHLVIIKERDTPSSGTSGWMTYHKGVNDANKYLRLEGTAAAQTASAVFGSDPTASVFSIGNDREVSDSSKAFIAYCFAPVAGYSAFGSYTGNSSTDGLFVYTGFRPRFLLFKRSSSTSNWVIMDTAINSYNVAQDYLRADLSNAETSLAAGLDILSNGFKFRTSAFPNDSATYIYAAFAENPFKYSRAR